MAVLLLFVILLYYNVMQNASEVSGNSLVDTCDFMLYSVCTQAAEKGLFEVWLSVRRTETYGFIGQAF